VFFQVHRADLDEGVVGSLYRSEIFYTSPEQRTVADEMIREVDASGHWPGKTPPFPRQDDESGSRHAVA